MYFGSADLDYYGIPCKSFVSHFVLPQKRFAVLPQPVEGTLLISATYYPGVFMGTPELNAFSPMWQVKPVRHTHVELRARVGRTGQIIGVTPVSGPSLLTLAAVAAVREWRYDPTFVDGDPVETMADITIVFRLP